MKIKEPKKYNKKLTRISSTFGNRKPYISLEEALNKIREVKVNKQKHTFYGKIILPQILVGHKVRLVLVNEDSHKKEQK